MAKFLLSASALAITVALAAGPAVADDITFHESLADSSGTSTDTDSLSEDAFALNVMHQNNDNDLSGEDVVEDAANYDGAVVFGDSTFKKQAVNVNGTNTGVNAAQQGGIALGADIAHDNSGGIGINTMSQVSTNDIDVDQLVDEDHSLYNGRVTFGVDTFKEQKVNVNGLNTGVNAAQQGGIAIGVNTQGGTGNPEAVGSFDTDTVAKAKTTFHAVSQDALAVNTMYQDQTNTATYDHSDAIDDGEYRANVVFGDNTFDEQKVNVNGLNTGINAGQQGGIAFAYDGASDHGAVALNVLTQVSVNEVTGAEDVFDDSVLYNADIRFGSNTFESQKVNVNGINTGMNSSQQGAIAVAVSGSPSES
jgi:hypothetical protein